MSLFTSNPSRWIDPDLRPFAKKRSRVKMLLALRDRVLHDRFGVTIQAKWLKDVFFRDLGKWLARTIDPEWTDVLHGLDGPGPEAGRIVQAHGKIWICDRGSSHILTQKQILEEEYDYWGAPPPRFSKEHLERCIAEYEEANAVVVPSQFARRSFLEQGIPAERLFLCPYGVDLTMFHPAGKADDVFRVIYVGGASIRKGIGHLLRAVEPLVKNRRCELWLVGGLDPDAQHILDQYRDLFEYKGIWPRRELWRMYSQASVLVLPSVEEGLALVQAQAMACRIPVIATTNTGAEDLFTDGVEGFIVSIRSPEAIREKIELLMENPDLREQMAEAALQRVKSLGGWDRYGEQINSVYREVAKRRQVTLSGA